MSPAHPPSDRDLSDLSRSDLARPDLDLVALDRSDLELSVLARPDLELADPDLADPPLCDPGTCGPGRHAKPRSRREVLRAAGALLALPVAGALTGAPAAAHTVAATSGTYIPIGGLTYRSGAGTETWGLRSAPAWSSRVIKHRYAVGTTYGYRSSSGDHGRRLAADFMVYSNRSKGDAIAAFARRHYKELNITYVIWYQRIWSVARASEGWRLMADRGSATANHRDHVHVSYREYPNNYTYRG